MIISGKSTHYESSLHPTNPFPSESMASRVPVEKSRVFAFDSVSIPKLATDPTHFARPTFSFSNARSAFKAYLLALGLKSEDEILLPAYIGWSSHEGSGVFDPIEEVGARFRFYRLKRDLCIDLDDLRIQITTGHPRLLVIIHYFGYPDPELAEVVALARANNVLVLEDEAHALYSDWVGGVCGRLGDAAIMSLHKMLPFRAGGLLLLNPSLNDASIEKLSSSTSQWPLEQSPLDFDLLRIAEARRVNAARLLELLPRLHGKVDPLFSTLPPGVVPQTLPVIITGQSRDQLYHEMNIRGYGVVSLYHTLVSAVSLADFPESHRLAHCIMNLPVHQDIQDGQLESMISCLEQLLE